MNPRAPVTTDLALGQGGPGAFQGKHPGEAAAGQPAAVELRASAGVDFNAACFRGGDFAVLQAGLGLGPHMHAHPGGRSRPQMGGMGLRAAAEAQAGPLESLQGAAFQHHLRGRRHLHGHPCASLHLAILEQRPGGAADPDAGLAAAFEAAAVQGRLAADQLHAGAAVAALGAEPQALHGGARGLDHQGGVPAAVHDDFRGGAQPDDLDVLLDDHGFPVAAGLHLDDRSRLGVAKGHPQAEETAGSAPAHGQDRPGRLLLFGGRRGRFRGRRLDGGKAPSSDRASAMAAAKPAASAKRSAGSLARARSTTASIRGLSPSRSAGSKGCGALRRMLLRTMVENAFEGPAAAAEHFVQHHAEGKQVAAGPPCRCPGIRAPCS